MQYKKNNLGKKHLLAWMREGKYTYLKAGNLIGTHGQRIWKWINGENLPNLALAVKLEEVTQGAVTCKDWTIPLNEKPENAKDNSPKNRNTRSNAKRSTANKRPTKTTK